MKLKPAVDEAGALWAYAFVCPGCGHAHVYRVSGATRWAFNGDLERPTFTPSLLNTCPHHPDPKQRRCHVNLTLGKLHFHGDCTHTLAGKVVDLPDFAW